MLFGPTELSLQADNVPDTPLRARGIAVIPIDRNLEPVLAVADRIMAMRGGRRAGVVATADASKRDVLGLIIGVEVEEMARSALSAAARERPPRWGPRAGETPQPVGSPWRSPDALLVPSQGLLAGRG